MTDNSQKANHLVDVYLSGITSITNDAGWAGDSMLSRLIQFQGEIPVGTGYDQSNMSMILAIEKLRNRHAIFDAVQRIVGSMLVTCGESDKILALLSKRYYRGVNARTEKLYSDRDRISSIGYAPMLSGDIQEFDRAWGSAERKYRSRVSAGRKLLLERMQITA